MSPRYRRNLSSLSVRRNWIAASNKNPPTKDSRQVIPIISPGLVPLSGASSCPDPLKAACPIRPRMGSSSENR
ncbi:hypothetical protein K0M31_007567, partial [Melipona bicolor]